MQRKSSMPMDDLTRMTWLRPIAYWGTKSTRSICSKLRSQSARHGPHLFALTTACNPCTTIPLFASWSRRSACRRSNECHEKRSCRLAPRSAHTELALGGGDVFGVAEFGFDVGDIALGEIVESLPGTVFFLHLWIDGVEERS